MELSVPEFAPRGIWRNGDLQSIVGSLPLRRPSVERRAKRLKEISTEEILDCGNGVRLTCLRARQPTGHAPVAVLIHGWEGSANSLYMLSASARLYEAGFEICRLQLRDHGNSHALNEGLFHSCRLDEVVDAVAAIQRSVPGRPLCLGGFSLGANFSLRIAVRAPDAGLDIARVVAICPVLHPPETLNALERGPWPYHYYFMRKWRRSLRIKNQHWPHRYDLDAIEAQKSMRDLTRHLITSYSEYNDLETYLNGYSIIGNALATLQVPSLLIAAEDDPIIPATHLDLLARPKALHIVATRFGGHCGYLEALDRPSWADTVLVAQFSAAAGIKENTETPAAANDTD